MKNETETGVSRDMAGFDLPPIMRKWWNVSVW